jgi:type IV pilus assembly protein PilQ
VVTSPKTVVLNKQKASIVQGIPVLVPVPVTTVPGGTTSTGTQVQQANIGLQVTPTVTNDGSVLLDLMVQRDVVVQLDSSQNGIGTRTLSTQVLVDSGNTLVIGGVYTLTDQHTAGGVPFLRNIPILGALFGTQASSLSRTELFIFITPRIINLKEAGLST